MKLSHNISKKDTGFSLAEILVSLVIVSVGSIGVGKLYTSMITGNADSKNRFEAATLAEAKLESLRFSHKVGDTIAITPGTEEYQGSNNTYVLSWEVNDIGQGQATLKSTVKWKDRNGEFTDATSISLSSVSSNVQESIAAAIATKPDPVFDVPEDKCNTLKVPSHGASGWSSYGAYGSTATSSTSCGSGIADTGSS